MDEQSEGFTRLDPLWYDNSMLYFNFQFEKTRQAAAELLRLHHLRMEYIRLLKLLYIVDRELLAEAGRTLTGDKAVAMKNGPVLSTVYKLIKSEGEKNLVQDWKSTIQRDGHEVVLIADVSCNRLTKREVNKLSEVSRRYCEVDSYELSELTHDFQEWRDVFDTSNPNSSYPMSWEQAMVAQGASELIEAATRLQESRSSFELLARE